MSTVTMRLKELVQDDKHASSFQSLRQYRTFLLKEIEKIGSEPRKITELFRVKFYTADEAPSIKGNGFDGLTIGESREEAEEFIGCINSLILKSLATKPSRKELLKLASKHLGYEKIDDNEDEEGGRPVEAYGSKLISLLEEAISLYS